MTPEQFRQHGHEVVIANSRGPETLTDLVDELGPSARAATRDEAAAAGEIVVVTTPLAAIAPGYLVRFRKQGRFGGRAERLAGGPVLR